MGLSTENANNQIFGPEDIERHAVELAKELQVKINSRFPKGLIGEINKNYKYILDVYKGLTKNGEEVFPSSPTAEWLLDNFYIIEEQVKDIRLNLSKKYYKQLPIIQRGNFKGYPRAYAIAMELVTHTDGRIDEETLTGFIKAFQLQDYLTIGELWAIAIMLRIALIRNIRGICENIVASQENYSRVEEISSLIIRNIVKGEEEILRLAKEQINSKDILSTGFVEHFLQKLRNQGSKTGVVVGYINERLKEADSSVEKAASLEHGIKAAAQVSMGNSITSLRLVSAIDWNDFFESLSQVENILREDPMGIYTQMDFNSRDSYRHEVETIALYYDTSEILVAEKAIECAKEAADSEGIELTSSHVGYYLKGKGRNCLEGKLERKLKGIKANLGVIKKYPAILYFGSMVILTALFVNVFLYYGFRNQGSVTPAIFLITGLVILFPISDIVITIINFFSSYIYKPNILPKLELKTGISPELSTMVIVPALLPNANRVKQLLEQLEISYLANREKNLYFTLVGDFKDSLTQGLPEDEEIIKTALSGIKELNSRYSSSDREIFYYFHRYRKFNSSQNKWMGWERKRGAILEINNLLLGTSDAGFDIISCKLQEVPKVKYVITLDADTSIPLGTAKRLIGTLAHPLNKAIVDWDKGVVIEGYGILQPRIGINLESANSSIFTRIFAGQGGIDPYTTAVFDVYQDLFGEGIFTGKGIYELEVFQGLLKNTIPENTVLSHDLLEGSYIRAGLVTDIELIDGYPGGYHSFSMRLHRWVRGDWQLIPWLTARVKDKEGMFRNNPISSLSKWKMVDNLRRSLLNPANFILLILSFSLLSSNNLLWVGLALFATIFPALMYLVGTLVGRNVHFINRSINSSIIWGFKAAVYQAVLQLLFIPYQAYLMTDAIIRTIFRVIFSKKNMLEWVTAADLESSLGKDVGSFYKRMWVSPVLGVFLLALAIFNLPRTVPLASLLLILWAGAPYVGYKISQEYSKDRNTLDHESNQVLRRLARKTWAYFEDMVTPTENNLPPDNYQVDPPNGIAHRTSPTNIGIMLTADVTARDLGYIGTLELYKRIDDSLNTIERMEKWEGHLYNWYDTRTLEVLRPRYISTVDSGNFVGYLMVLDQALKEYAEKPLIDSNMAMGLRDTISLLKEEIEEAEFTLSLEAIDIFLNSRIQEKDNWIELLEKIQSDLTQENYQGISKNPWGKKLLTMVKNFRLELDEIPDNKLDELYENLNKRINKLINDTRFVPLFDSKRQLFSIGYNVEEGMLTKSFYDLLASEARQASYIAIARGEVDKKHWFRLGRKLTQMDRGKGLLSWTGTMFEYLMPLLIMGNYENSLLDETYNFVLQAQKRYGRKRNIPWGTSESAYYAFDINLNYQYKAFGVPELGFKRGLANDMVVAPYATVLALMVDPQGAVENIKRLLSDGLDGEYGLYEAIDYTPSRTPDSKGSIIKNFMVHHQGMSILALNNYLNNNIMQARFHANPIIRSAELLLQERIPTRAVFSKEYKDDFVPVRRVSHEEGEAVREFGIPDSGLPKTHLLSNGSYSVMVTNGGSGYSKYQDMSVARWRANQRGTNTGIYIYLQNINSNNVWSATFEPYNVNPEEYTVVFSPDKAKFARKDGNIETNTEIVVSPEDNAEIRRVALTNHSEHSRVIEVTSYLEVVLTHPDADIAHPTFSNLFVTTEYAPAYNCLLASRRPRSEGQKTVWAMHTLVLDGETIGDLQYETDRAKFIGRNRDLSNPLAMAVDQPLSNTVGAVLDPVFSLRKRVRIEPGQTIRLSYTVAIADSRKNALILADKYRDLKTVERAFQLAWNRSLIEGRFLGLKANETELYLNMVPEILFSSPLRQRWADTMLKNKKGQPGLWLYGISGDILIVLLAIKNKEHLEKVYSLLKAHEFWRMKGLTVDLVILIEDESGYSQPLQDRVRDAILATHARDMIGRNGGVFMLNAELMPEEDKVLLFTVARVILKGDQGPIQEQIIWQGNESKIPKLAPSLFDKAEAIQENKGYSQHYDTNKLKFFNGLGGFSQDGKEYVIYLREGQHTPAPWINVISNHQFGFNISEVGGGYTWAENSRENKLTPWYNDPVTDTLGEVFYLRDDANGDYWSLTPMPIRGKEDYIIRHGQGYSAFEHRSHNIEQTLTEFVSLEDPVKLSLIKLRNSSNTARELSLTYYIRPVMGVNEKVNSQYITTESYGEKGVLLIQNSYNGDFPGRVGFIDSSELERTVSGDRGEFIGINRDIDNPEAMEMAQLSGRLGAGFDPCCAMQVKVRLEPGEERDIVFLLGQGQDIKDALRYADKYSNITQAQNELAKVKEFWQAKLEAIQVQTPDDSFDFLVNGWLQYQVISCRLWSRAAFYQSGGAYGFRDQLQDVMSVVYNWPELTRKQILLHSAHQFLEGDVQHWWHPGVDKGIRTRYSDDLLWLPYVTADYIQATEDWSILEEETTFLESEPLQHEDERYDIPRISEEKANVYEHCIRAIERALRFGEHGIPLMGSGDWNDGMNTVGNKGKGESIWLGWFLYTVLQKFIPICIARKDNERAERYRSVAEGISQAIEEHGWDGSWYRRAYFDDGTPLGSAQNTECKIDAIAQSWSIISGIGRPHRAEEAMNAVENYLVDREAGIIKLLTPPFHEGNLEPGYIKSYIPGVRENGGQYTHAAIWTVMAFARLGKGDKVGELFHLINPINHARTPLECARYKVEPYVVAADVYAVQPNTGRGGWSWYTGAAGWMYRLAIEYILGIKKLGASLSFDPCIPREWGSFNVEYKYLNTLYHIRVKNPHGVSKGVQRITLDGTIYDENRVELRDDGIDHLIEVVMGEEGKVTSEVNTDVKLNDPEIQEKSIKL